MATKNFTVEANQKVWDIYFNMKIEEGKNKTSVAQYKPALLALDALTNKSFSDITVSDIETLMEQRQGKNANHLNGFLVTMINEGHITPNKDVICHLIPVEYRNLVQLLVK